MNARIRMERFIRNPRLAALAYCLGLLVAGFTALSAIADIVDGYRAVEVSRQALARLEQHCSQRLLALDIFWER